MLEGRERTGAPTDQTQAAPATAAAETPDASAEDGTEARAAAPVTAPIPRPPGQPAGVARIKVIGVGGGGSNAVARMYRQRMPGVEYVAVNTDAQHLLHIDVPAKLRIGERLTRGLGVGGDPELGYEAAEESREELYDLLAGTDLVFITCGMGGGTGTGAAPLIAEIARSLGALTIATVTKPFSFEGYRRIYQAEQGIAKLRPHVDTLIMIPNDRLVAIADAGMTAENAFRIADDVLRQGVQSIAELVTITGEINLDFADVRTVMMGSGPAWMAIGHGRGENRATDAAREAMASPLIDVPI
ncbi:MAG: cell division protein FtsZ, partial [Chloroflexi bacterium]|nr:cell division protein FtsZ [Chloroflexota bacterium]